MGFLHGLAVKKKKKKIALKKNSPMQETWVQSLGQEDSLEESMAAHSIILVWRIQWTEEPSGLQFIWSQRVSHDWSNWAFTYKDK